MRKKAKYLHDAPPEALRPVLGPNYDPHAISSRPTLHRQSSTNSGGTTASNAGGTFFSQGPAPAFPIYQGRPQPSVGIPDGLPYSTQPSPVSASFAGATNNNATQMDSIMPPTMDFNALFDPSNPALYNFDLEGLNFGSQYAGWEFGILNKMGLGAETPPREGSMSQTPTGEYTSVFGNGPGALYDTGGNNNNNGMLTGDFSGMDQSQILYNQGNLQHGLPHAYAIATGPTSLHSPSTDATASPQAPGIVDSSPTIGGFGTSLPISSAAARIKPNYHKTRESILGKRQRDAASIYESVKEPYPYTKGFHKMVSVLRDRLPLSKLLRIARALGEIRPSFIACTKDLTREDLIFMEKCFQRTLVEFDDFLHHCCAPTIVCRRSGEVAAVNKEFTALTGWTKDVLLGKEPNKHINGPVQSNGSVPDTEVLGQFKSADSQNSEATADDIKDSNGSADDNDGRLQPIFLAELLDDDSTVEFYKDFAQLAFEDSRGKVQRSCRLVKYHPQESSRPVKSEIPKNGPSRVGILSSRVTKIDGEHGISRIEQDGKVSCTYCWTIKRDVFDIPMMIIINVSTTVLS